ncbi:MAG: DNA recombination protein RmuC [Flavobacteriales bacterium]|nr:DNA recombination protein RmuC [Flavobacteriales bacterium]
MEYTDLLIGIFLGLSIGFLAAFLFFKFGKASKELLSLKSEREFLTRSIEKSERSELEQRLQLEELKDQIINVKENNARLAQKEENLKEEMLKWKEEKRNLDEQMHLRFEDLANKIIDRKTQKLDESSNKNLKTILDPLKEKLKHFEDKVEKIYKEENDQRVSLKTEVKHLLDLNKQLSKDANNLATALKGDNKTQGNWGEVVLERVLESSGLEKGREYKIQYTEADEHGKPQRPDVVVELPENKHIIIDSKVSIVAYERYIQAEDKAEKEACLKEHIQSVRAHIKGLSEKNYQGLQKLNTPDFVLLFMPIEASLGLAAGHDEGLWNYAWQKKIVLVSPATLLATLRTVSSIWKHEKQNLNAIEIARQAGAMLDKFNNFTEDMIQLGKRMDTAKKSYEGAMNKLVDGKDNLIVKSNKLKELGVRTKKSIDQRLLDRSLTDSQEEIFSSEK